MTTFGTTDTCRIIHRSSDDSLILLEKGLVFGRVKAGALTEQTPAELKDWEESGRVAGISGDGALFERCRGANDCEIVSTDSSRVVSRLAGSLPQAPLVDAETEFDPTGRFVVTGGSALVSVPLRVWEVATGRRLDPFGTAAQCPR